jgi:hypothetical protein
MNVVDRAGHRDVIRQRRLDRHEDGGGATNVRCWFWSGAGLGGDVHGRGYALFNTLNFRFQKVC